MASRHSNKTCCDALPVARYGDMTIAWMGFVFQALLSYQGLFLIRLFDQWGPEIVDDPELAHRAHFEPWALGGADEHGEHENPKWWTLDSLMELNGARSRSHSPDPILSRN